MVTYNITTLFDGQDIHQNVHLTIENGCIRKIESAANSKQTASIFLDGFVCPGFIDLQVNGGGGVLFNHEPNVNCLSMMLQGHAKYGTTSMLPTLITDNSDTMEKAAEAVSMALSQSLPGVLGIHFEGPHLSCTKRGIHPVQEVRPINDRDLRTITRGDLGKVMLTIAPENVPTDIIRDLVNKGVIVSLGHSNTSCDVVLEAVDAGAMCFTHLFNAMSGLQARMPGVIGAGLCDERTSSGIIADMHHVHPLNLKLAYKCLGHKRLFLVTDAMAHVGTNMQSLPWQDSNITRDGSKLTLNDGSLAGSCLDMASAIKNMLASLVFAGNKVMQRADFTNTDLHIICEVLNMANTTPASLFDIEHKGFLKEGYDADFVVLDDKLNVDQTWIGGIQVAKNNH